MEVIRDSNGNIIQKSRNLRGIREYVSKHLVKVMAIERIADGEGKLLILFEDKSSFECNFADFTVLRDFVRRWRNVYGSPIRVNGQDAGVVSYQNSALI